MAKKVIGIDLGTTTSDGVGDFGDAGGCCGE